MFSQPRQGATAERITTATTAAINKSMNTNRAFMAQFYADGNLRPEPYLNERGDVARFQDWKGRHDRGHNVGFRVALIQSRQLEEGVQYEGV